MVIDKEEALELLTARFDSVREIPKRSQREGLISFNTKGGPKSSFYRIEDKMGGMDYALIVKLNEYRSGDLIYEFKVSMNETLYERIGLDLPNAPIADNVQAILDSMNRILLRSAG